MEIKKIKNYENYQITEDGMIISTAQLSKKVLKPQKASQSKKKYLQVRLFNEESPRCKNNRKMGKLFYVHRLVWEMFKGEIPKNKEIDHIDGNTHNNDINNLQLLTKRENILREYKKEDVRYLREHRDEIIKDYIEIRNYKILAKKWNCGIGSIYRIIKNRIVRYDSVRKYMCYSYDESCEDLFSITDLRNKTKQQLIELWEKNYGVKYNSELG